MAHVRQLVIDDLSAERLRRLGQDADRIAGGRRRLTAASWPTRRLRRRIDPTLDQFTDLARHLRQEAEEQARRHGRALSAAIPAAMAARSLCPRDHTRSPVRDERPLDERVPQPTLSW